MPLLPVALYGLEVPCGNMAIPAESKFPATFRITMAAIDPTAKPIFEEGAEKTTPRATLKIIRSNVDQGDDESDDEEAEYMRALLGGSDSDDSEDEAGPSDPAKSKKAKKEAALKQLMESIKNGEESDEDMEDVPAKKSKKGKAIATGEESEDSEEGSDDEEEDEVEEFVLCTLDPEKHYQQPLDITIGENEEVFFQVSGTHNVFLTGNYLVPDDHGHNHHQEVLDSDDEDDEDYDLSPDEDELEEIDEEDDELDGLADPRITEVESEDEAPKLVKAEKANKKRSAADLEPSLDEIMAKTAEEPKLSKKQLKKIKKNNGDAAPVETEAPSSVKSDKSTKKVEFAEKLIKGPTPSAEKPKVESEAPKTKTVDGVKIEDKKVGSGKAAKKGDRCGMRYIGKLTDGKVFDSNKKGKPFSFKLGSGEVIRGWDLGIAGMQVGGERRITIPSRHAYGSKAIPNIPAGSTLVFDIKLLELK